MDPYSHAFEFVMPSTPTTEAEIHAGTSSTAGAAAREPADVEYPEGRWIAQSVSHGVAVAQAVTALDRHFRERGNVLVAMELVVYYERGRNQAKLQPDVQVVFGVTPTVPRSSYKIWEEGKAPDFVLEVASPSTADKDALQKAHDYARIGVREYWRLDPQGSLMSIPLEGYVARGGRFGPVERVAGGQRMWSEVLGLELRGERQAMATVLVFRDPVTGTEFDSAATAEAKRASDEARRRRLAEKRVRELEAKLRNRAENSPPSEREP